MTIFRNILRLLLPALILLGMSPAAAAPARPLQSVVQALHQDAQEYALQFGVPADQAFRRLAAQQESVAATDRLQEQYRDRLAGLVIEHLPDYRITILLTGDAPVADTIIPTSQMTIPVTFRTGARASREKVVGALSDHQAELRSRLKRPPSLGADPRTGELIVMLSKRDAASHDPAALRAEFEALTGVPVQLRTSGAEQPLALGGGARLVGTEGSTGRRLACTTGFAVTDGVRTGIVTAAHCPDDAQYMAPGLANVPLEFAGQWGAAYQDVQLHLTGEPVRSSIYSDSAKETERPITTWRPRTSTRAGDFLCHRGESTGFSCALVQLVDFAPAGDLCAGPCTPTWTTVAGPTCRSGDSGSPVFSGTVAFGILKGGSYGSDGACHFYFYMSTDYLPEGWTLLVDGADTATAGTHQPGWPGSGAGPSVGRSQASEK
jgi:streptogrisin C